MHRLVSAGLVVIMGLLLALWLAMTYDVLLGVTGVIASISYEPLFVLVSATLSCMYLAHLFTQALSTHIGHPEYRAHIAHAAWRRMKVGNGHNAGFYQPTRPARRYIDSSTIDAVKGQAHNEPYWGVLGESPGAGESKEASVHIHEFDAPSEEEKKLGYVRPLRKTYAHVMGINCGLDALTTIPDNEAIMWAKDPKWNVYAWCGVCKTHGRADAFLWTEGSKDVVGT